MHKIAPRVFSFQSSPRPLTLSLSLLIPPPVQGWGVGPIFVIGGSGEDVTVCVWGEHVRLYEALRGPGPGPGPHDSRDWVFTEDVSFSLQQLVIE